MPGSRHFREQLKSAITERTGSNTNPIIREVRQLAEYNLPDRGDLFGCCRVPDCANRTQVALARGAPCSVCGSPFTIRPVRAVVVLHAFSHRPTLGGASHRSIAARRLPPMHERYEEQPSMSLTFVALRKNTSIEHRPKASDHSGVSQTQSPRGIARGGGTAHSSPSFGSDAT